MLVDAPFNTITREIIAAAIEVHRVLGPGLLESVYLPCIEFELSTRKLRFASQCELPVVYKEISLNARYRVDLIVEGTVVVEIKSVAAILPVHQAQLLTYLRLSGQPAGLLINFHVPKLVTGVKRLINDRARTPD